MIYQFKLLLGGKVCKDPALVAEGSPTIISATLQSLAIKDKFCLSAVWFAVCYKESAHKSQTFPSHWVYWVRLPKQKNTTQSVNYEKFQLLLKLKYPVAGWTIPNFLLVNWTITTLYYDNQSHLIRITIITDNDTEDRSGDVAYQTEFITHREQHGVRQWLQ